MEEIEVKFLDIDPVAIEEKLIAIGAKKVGEYFYRRRILDFPDLRLNKDLGWVRIRDEGNQVTLSFKQRIGVSAHDGSSNDGGMTEVQVIVSDFDKTTEIFKRIGMIEKFYQENRRVRWMKGDVEFDLDSWPRLPTFLEIEGPSRERVAEAINWLGLNPEDKKVFSSSQVYALHGIDPNDYQRMTFEEFVKKV
jgi:adenylate cyclase class 2